MMEYSMSNIAKSEKEIKKQKKQERLNQALRDNLKRRKIKPHTPEDSEENKSKSDGPC